MRYTTCVGLGGLDFCYSHQLAIWVFTIYFKFIQNVSQIEKNRNNSIFECQKVARDATNTRRSSWTNLFRVPSFVRMILDGGFPICFLELFLTCTFGNTKNLIILGVITTPPRHTPKHDSRTLIQLLLQQRTNSHSYIMCQMHIS